MDWIKAYHPRYRMALRMRQRAVRRARANVRAGHALGGFEQRARLLALAYCRGVAYCDVEPTARRYDHPNASNSLADVRDIIDYPTWRASVSERLLVYVTAWVLAALSHARPLQRLQDEYGTPTLFKPRHREVASNVYAWAHGYTFGYKLSLDVVRDAWKEDCNDDDTI